MLDKRYKPEIEEFHIGFEYVLIEEFLDEEECAYYEEVPKTFLPGDKITFEECVRVNGYALYHTLVKYLDEEDIKSLGFKLYATELTDPMRYYFQHEDKNLYLDFSYGSYDNDTVTIYYFTKINSRVDIFKGTVKNKSELKQILKMITKTL